MGLIKPDKYVHPNKRKRHEASEKAQAQIPVENSKEAVKNKNVELPVDQSDLQQPLSTITGETVLIRLVARVPEQGQIAFYDSMIVDGLSPKEAILGIWKREFGNLDTTIADYDFKTSCQLGFEKRKAIETTRKITPDALRTIQSKIDPYNILTDRALGQKLGEALLIQSGKES